MKDASKTKRPWGFALLTPEKRKEISRLGGQAVPASSRSFSKSETAKAAGRKGGLATRRKRLGEPG